MSYKELLSAYEVDVQFSDVSGMEHLDMLMTRSEIAKHEPHLSDGERVRLLNADKSLRNQAFLFYQAIQEIADLASWRREADVPSSHWWWYLDVITQMQQQTQSIDQNLASAHI